MLILKNFGLLQRKIETHGAISLFLEKKDGKITYLYFG
jgi:hypothetical protein